MEKDEFGLWNEIGETRARRKTSQLLREDAPSIREKVEARAPRGSSDDDAGSIELARQPTKRPPAKAHKRATAPKRKAATAKVASRPAGIKAASDNNLHMDRWGTAGLQPSAENEFPLPPHNMSTGENRYGGPMLGLAWGVLEPMKGRPDHFGGSLSGLTDCDSTNSHSFDTPFLSKTKPMIYTKTVKVERHLRHSDESHDRKPPGRQKEPTLPGTPFGDL